MDSNWRSALAHESRQKIINKIMETLQRHMPPSGQEGMHELRKIASRFEEKIYQAATNQNDYLQKISGKLFQLENRSQAASNNSISANSNGPNSLDTGSLVTRNQAHSAASSLQQSLSRQPPLPVQSTVQSGISGVGIQSSSALGSSLSSLTCLPQASFPSVGAQGSGLPSIIGINQNSLPNATGQTLAQNVLLGSQRLQLHSRQQQQATPQQPPLQQQVAPSQQQQQQVTAQQQPIQQTQQQQQQMIYQQRLQQQTVLLKQKLQQQQSMQQPVLQQPSQSVVQQQQHQIPILQSQQQSQSLLNQQNNVQSLQQQQLLQQQLLQQAKVHQQQQTQQAGASMATLLPQPQHQQASILSQPQQQPSLLTQAQSQQLQQQSTLIHDQPQRLQQSSNHLQQSNLLDHQKQVLQVQQRGVSEASSTSVDSSGQTGQTGIIDPQDIVWVKMQVLKEKYLQDMKKLFELLKNRSQQPMPPEQFQKLTHYMNVLHRMIQYLVAPKGSLHPEFKQDKVDTFEKQIANIMGTFNRHTPTPQQQVANPQQQMQSVDSVQSIQQQQQQQQQHQQQHSQHSPQMLQQEKIVLQSHQLNSQTGGANFSNNMPALQKSSCSILQPSTNTLQQNMVNSMQSGASNVLQGSSINSLQQNNFASLQQLNVTNMQQSQQMLQQDQQQLLQAQQQRLLKDQEQLKQLQQQRQLQQLTSDMKVDLKAKQAAALHQVILQQQHKQHMNQRTLLQQQLPQQQQPTKIGQSQVVSSPPVFQAASPQILQQLTPQIDQANIVAPGVQISKVGVHFQSTPPFMTPSPSMLSAASPSLEDMEIRAPTPAVSSLTTVSCAQNMHPVVTQSGSSMLCASTFMGDLSPSPQSLGAQEGKQCPSSGVLLGEKYTPSEPPLERLVKLINSMSSRSLSSAVDDMKSIINLSDKLAGSAPGSQSRAVVGEDLALMTKCKLQAKSFQSQEGSVTSKRRKHLDSVAVSMVSSDGSVVNSLQKLNGPDSSEILSTATSQMKMPRFDISQALEEEIKQINNELIDTSIELVGDAVDEVAREGRGVVLTCSYNAVAMDPSIQDCSDFFQMASISPMRLLIPSNYPDCSPVVLTDKLAPSYNLPVSRLARDEFGRVARCLPQPVSLRAMTRAWDECARNAVAQVAALNGGGCFSTSYGSWESCVSA